MMIQQNQPLGILTTTASEALRRRKDVVAMLFGVVFSLLFTGLIWWAGGRLESIPHLPDQGASWYYWRLIEPTFWSRATAWGFYLFHQLSIFALIYFAQTRVRRYTTGLHPVNWAALSVNAFFIALHFVQTHLWYDGLAQDVSIWSSQASVVVLLVWVLLMENRRRGMFFGKPLPISKSITRFARKYHGYFFAWATIYTFWYHPMEATSGHLIGFFYMFLLLLQGSLFFTRIHINRWWTFTQEVIVLIHGTLVAIMQGNDLWPMFAFGFGGIFIITQMHGLGLSRITRWLFLITYIASALWVYSSRGWERLNEIIRIPAIDYLAVIILAALFGGGLWIAKVIRSNAPADRKEFAP
jgi:hypothetical protein